MFSMINRFIASVVMLLFLTACQTTGDPSKGGLIGWDEEKAKLRAQELEKRSQQKKRLLVFYEQEEKKLENDKRDAATSVEVKMMELAGLRTNAMSLLAEIADLEMDNIELEMEVECLNELLAIQNISCSSCIEPDNSLLEQLEGKRSIQHTSSLDVGDCAWRTIDVIRTTCDRCKRLSNLDFHTLKVKELEEKVTELKKLMVREKKKILLLTPIEN